MAKRRKLEAPSAEDLGKIEEEFRRETPGVAAKAPIAQVASEAAGQFQTTTAEMRRDEAQAAAYRAAEGQGRLIKQIGVNEIEATSLQRDRTVMDAEALGELEHSLEANGLRLPIEIYVLKKQKASVRYGLISGYRRLIAQRNLLARTGDTRFGQIKAVVREADQMGGAFIAMVEENEIRQDLSHYERGRIAAIAAQQGAFDSTEDAVAGMFAAASKAKRSKIRSFAMIFEELGDLLQFPEGLREKDGLRLAQALRNGTEGRLRHVLGAGQAEDARSEWALIDATLRQTGGAQPDPKRGGRPKAQPPAMPADGEALHTSTGISLTKEIEGKDILFRVSGSDISDEMIARAMRAAFKALDSR